MRPKPEGAAGPDSKYYAKLAEFAAPELLTDLFVVGVTAFLGFRPSSLSY